jgi:hypothetical protein
LDWKRTSISWSDNGTTTHTPLSGIAGNATNGWLGSGVNHSACTLALQDDQHFVIGLKTVGAINKTLLGTVTSGATVAFATSGVFTNYLYRIGIASASTTVSATITAGRYLANRTVSTTHTLDKNGTQVSTNAATSVARVAGEICALRTATVYSDGALAFAGFGGGLTGGQRTAYDARLATFVTAMSVTL